MAKKITQEEANKLVFDACERKNYTFKSFVYNNRNTRIDVHCNVCGYEWDILFENLTRNPCGCPDCAGLVKRTQEQAENEVRQKCNERNYKFGKFVYVNNQTKIPLICHCGYEWVSCSFSKFVHGNRGCPRCSKKIQLTQEEATKKVDAKCKENNYLYKEFSYIGVDDTRLFLICHCGYDWNCSFDKFVNSGTGCPKCGGRLQLTQEEAEERVLSKCKEHNYTYKPFCYLTNETKISLICHCGYEWDCRYSLFVMPNGTGCPKCSHNDGQLYSYIHSITDDDGNLISVKYGIETTINSRNKSQNKLSNYNISVLNTYKYITVEQCKNAEKECIKLFQKENKELFGRKGYITKEEMRDGWTETTSVSNIEKIISIYEKWGGIKQ